MDIFKLYRNFWDYAFANPEKIKPNHIAIYSFAIEHCNRLGWKEKFGLPASMVLEATGIKSYGTYKKTFDELVEFGFIKVVQYSKNQYSSNIVALSYFDKANAKALDKALSKHMRKHFQSTCESNDSIDIQSTNIQVDVETKNSSTPPPAENNFIQPQTAMQYKPIDECRKEYDEKYLQQKQAIQMNHMLNDEQMKSLQDSFDSWIKTTTEGKIMHDYCTHFSNWVNKNPDKIKLAKTPISKIKSPHAHYGY
jgi:hypothetical protein